MKRHGLLAELLEQEKREEEAKLEIGRATVNGDSLIHSNEANEIEGDSDDETQELLVRTVSIRDAIGNQGREAANFLQKMDCDIKNIIASTNSRKDTLEEVTATLTCKRIHPFHKHKGVFSGIDCGIQWRGIIATVVIVGLVAPLLYILYFEFLVKPASDNTRHKR